jgi:hypothetical protein
VYCTSRWDYTDTELYLKEPKEIAHWVVTVWQKLTCCPDLSLLFLFAGSCWLSSSNEWSGCCCGSPGCHCTATVSVWYVVILTLPITCMPCFMQFWFLHFVYAWFLFLLWSSVYSPSTCTICSTPCTQWLSSEICLDFKILPLLYNAPDCPQSLYDCSEDSVVFLSPSLTFLIQSIYHGDIVISHRILFLG